MEHSLEQSQRKEGLEDDGRRLGYVRKKISDCLAGTPGYEKETLECLSGVKAALEKGPELAAHLPELNILFESVRYMIFVKRVVPYKAHDPRTDASRVTKEVEAEQKQLRRDMVEWSSTLRWHILNNKENAEYLRLLWETLSAIWNKGGWADEVYGFERGIYTEVGVYRLLEKYGAQIDSFPHEDAELGTDFWVTRPNGTRCIVQAKSSSPARMGVHSNDQLKEIVAKWEKEKSMPPERVGQVTKIIHDLDNAYAHARERGLMVDGTYLIVLSSDLVSRPSGEPQWDKIKELEAQVEMMMKD